MRLMRWARSGVWERLFVDLVADKKNQYLMLDSTIVRAHQQATTGRKKGPEDPALGRSRGGLSTKIHLLLMGRACGWHFASPQGRPEKMPLPRSCCKASTPKP